MVGLTTVLAVQTVRMLMAKAIAPRIEGDADLPTVSILVPAKNESVVLPDLIHSLFHLNYPSTHLDIWIVDDGSTDETPQILRKLQTEFSGLQVHRRESKGGKSGALMRFFPSPRERLCSFVTLMLNFLPIFCGKQYLCFRRKRSALTLVGPCPPASLTESLHCFHARRAVRSSASLSVRYKCEKQSSMQIPIS